jgi:hypothetical protein
MGQAGNVVCCLVVVVGIIALFVWLPRRARGAIGNAIDRQVAGLGPASHVLDGLATALNARSSQATRAQLRVGRDYVAVARLGMASRIKVEIFGPEEILSVHEGNIARTGLDGFLANKNANTNFGRALGLSADASGIVLRTHRGDVAFTVTPKYRGELRQTYIAIGALIGRPESS